MNKTGKPVGQVSELVTGYARNYTVTVKVFEQTGTNFRVFFYQETKTFVISNNF